MGLRVSGKHLDIGASLRAHIGTRIEAIIAKYAADPSSGHVTIAREGSGFRTDCILHLGTGIILQVEAEATDAYASFNKAADRIENRLRRVKRRARDRVSVNAQRVSIGQASGAAARASVDAENAEEASALVIAEPSATLKEMSVSCAVKELDVANVPVVVFRHASDGRTNIVYRRADGNIGWIDAAGFYESPAI